ncbi:MULTISPECIES: hypothetical protein [Aeromonas]|uniref:hypothetical protein n=1 Tax=Aeromonas TaxID=642 RepID=UPI001269AAD4|nr:hypothetical protein [Aeromonas caviae]
MNKKIVLIIASSITTIGVIWIGLWAFKSGAGLGLNVKFAATSECNKDYPLLITVTNRLPIALEYYQFRIEARRPGRSSFVRNESIRYESDVILNGWSSHSSCWKAPWIDLDNIPVSFDDDYVGKYKSKTEKDNENLIWSVGVRYARWGSITFGYRS